MHVDDVVAAVLELLGQERSAVRRKRQPRLRAVHRQGHRAAQRHVVIRQGPSIRPTTVDQAGKAVIRVVGRENAHVVSLRQELLGKGLDVSPHSPRIRG